MSKSSVILCQVRQERKTHTSFITQTAVYGEKKKESKKDKRRTAIGNKCNKHSRPTWESTCTENCMGGKLGYVHSRQWPHTVHLTFHRSNIITHMAPHCLNGLKLCVTMRPSLCTDCRLIPCRHTDNPTKHSSDFKQKTSHDTTVSSSRKLLKHHSQLALSSAQLV